LLYRNIIWIGVYLNLTSLFSRIIHFSMNWSLLWIVLLSVAAGAYAIQQEGDNVTEVESNRNGKSKKKHFKIYQTFGFIKKFSEHSFLIFSFFSIFAFLHCPIQKHWMQKSKCYEHRSKVIQKNFCIILTYNFFRNTEFW